MSSLRLGGLSAGDTNLSCPHCYHQFDLVEIPELQPDQFSPDSYSACSQCGGWFFPENGVLETYYQREVSQGFINAPLSLGTGIISNHTSTSIGGERPHRMNNLYSDYEFDVVIIKGANRADVDESDWLEFEFIGDGHSRVELGDAIVVSVDKNNPQELSVSSVARNEGFEAVNAEMGDEVTVVYNAFMELGVGVDPPWVELLLECRRAVEQESYVSAVPLLYSALENAIFRQVCTYYRWAGEDRDSARARIWDEYGNKHGDVYTKDLAKGAMKEITGTSLTSAQGPYGELWVDFWGDEGVRETRNQIIHPDEGSMVDLDRDRVVEWFDLTMNLILGAFKLMRDVRY